jgi:formate dehydrogenase iron-sulfur subunit
MPPATLPLLESELLYRPAPRRRADTLVQIGVPSPLIPAREPGKGEQYRFHFDMTKCIGCKCCVVACNEQNGNPATINWRRVGEVEGGHYPNTQRHYLSMGCNHCVEPACMIGCPVEAYQKDPKTGVVLHDANTCIGCQYCTWNCSYGVPQYNPERGVVGKCDMCHNRLSDGMAPACVNACPEGAISIEIVNVDEWREEYGIAANAPGMPSASDSISTTRVTLPQNLSPGVDRVDTQRIELDHPHWPLVFMLVLTQLAAGAFTVLWLLDAMNPGAQLGLSALASLGIAAVSLAAAPLHLGRPAYAHRALKGLRTSWLSREVLSLGLFAGVAAAFAAMLALDLPGRTAVGALTAVLGAVGVMSSARIYMVRARPAWHTPYTMTAFYATGLLLGPLFIRAMGVSGAPWIAWAAAAGGVAQLLTESLRFLWLTRSEQFELRATALLLSGRLRQWFLWRMGIVVLAGIVLPLISAGFWPALATLGVALAGEWLGRWLFFVSVVGKNTASSFIAAGGRRSSL